MIPREVDEFFGSLERPESKNFVLPSAHCVAQRCRRFRVIRRELLTENPTKRACQMRFQIEFFRHSEGKPEGVVVRRNSGQFASEKDVEIYGITERPDDADGFRILKDDAVRKTVLIKRER